MAIAVGVSGGQRPGPGEALADCALVGELSLSGEIRPVRGALAAALGARGAGTRGLLVPLVNGPEAALVEGVGVAAMPTLGLLAEMLHDRWEPAPVEASVAAACGAESGARPRGRARPGGRQAALWSWPQPAGTTC